jgi:hypothetical protein
MIVVVKDRHTGSIETITNVTRIVDLKQDRITRRNTVEVFRLDALDKTKEVSEGNIKLNDSEVYILPQD